MSEERDNNETVERLVVLESKLAYQDQIIEELNGVVTKQQGQIDQLTSVVRKLKEISDSMPGEGVEAGEEPPPPHY